MTYEFWHDFAGPIATVIATLIGSIAALVVTVHFGRAQARIAHEQARTAEQQAELARVRLQHDLYDRRILVFGAVRDLLLTEFSPKSTISREALGSFIRNTRNSIFVFDQDMVLYLEEMVQKAIRLETLNRRWLEDTLKSNVDQPKLEREIDDLSAWFSKQYPISVKKFEKIMSLQRHRN